MISHLPTDEARLQDRERTVTRKGYLPPEVTTWNSNVLEPKNLLKFPLGDLDNFHLSSAAYAMSLQKEEGSMRGWNRFAPYEKAYFDALGNVKAANGDGVSGVDGGYLAPEFWSQRLFDVLRNFAILDQLPVTKITVPYRVLHLPKVATDVTISYPNESVAPTATTFGFGEVEYTARKAIAVINASNEWIRDSPSAVDQLWQQSAAKAIAQDRDLQALTGGGSGASPFPVGLVNNPAVKKQYPGATAAANISTTPNSATPSFNHVSQLKAATQVLFGNSNVSAGQVKVNGIIAHTRFEQTVFTLGTAAGPWTDNNGRPLLQNDLNAAGGLFGTQWFLTNLLPTQSTDGGGSANSYMIAGAWENYVLFECLTLGFDATLHGQGMQADQTQVRIVHRYDAGPIHPEAFGVLAGCLQ